MAGKKRARTATERSRESRQRKKQQEIDEYIQSLPSSSSSASLSEEEKLLKYNQMKNEKMMKPKSTADRCKEYRIRKKQESIAKRSLEVELNQESVEPVSKQFITESSFADIEFQKRFYENTFGSDCGICNRLWFERDMRQIPSKAVDLVARMFPGEKSTFKVCETCYKSLGENKIPRLSRTNGFRYPQFPAYLPPLDPICERLVSPRIPFMQIRRLRFVYGAKGIIGQVINVPVDVNEMVQALPRQLDDDYAFNVNIKRHQIHKSSYLTGMVKKSHVKAWLGYLQSKPLYGNIKIDKSFFGVNDADGDVDRNEEIIESISEDQEHVHEMLLAKQHTLMWSEEKYLDIAPGMNRQPSSLIYDT